MRPMTRSPQYCQGFKDRHGKWRWYFRQAGQPRVALPGMPWTSSFMAAYEAALNQTTARNADTPSQIGTISGLIASYYRSGDYGTLAVSTQKTYRGILERFRADHGDKRVDTLTAKHVQRLISQVSDRPAASRNLLKIISVLMRHAVDRGWRNDNPTKGIRKPRSASKGFTTWEEHHIEAFQAYHKDNFRAILALNLLLYTGQRRSDVVLMGWGHVIGDVLTIIQQKTKQIVHIPLHETLKDNLESLPRTTECFLVTRNGQGFTPESFTNWMRKLVVAAGLEDGLSPHGLRKATCRRLAEAGCSPNQIMAISGHQTLQEVTRYTAAAARKELAAQAMNSLK